MRNFENDDATDIDEPGNKKVADRQKIPLRADSEKEDVRSESAVCDREETILEREHSAVVRENAADLREGKAISRDAAADLREGKAVSRDAAADLREVSATSREEAAGLREQKFISRESEQVSQSPEGTLAAADERTELVRQANARLVVAAIEAHELAEQAEAAKAQMDHLAHHDVLTNLPNRMLLLDRLGQAIELARRRGQKLAVMFMDLDRFKHINDSLGHAVGDRLLQSVG